MSKISINQLHMALSEANSILLTVHVHPDGDAIGSMLAFYEALLAQGKQVTMVVDDSIPEKFSFLSHWLFQIPPISSYPHTIPNVPTKWTHCQTLLLPHIRLPSAT